MYKSCRRTDRQCRSRTTAGAVNVKSICLNIKRIHNVGPVVTFMPNCEYIILREGRDGREGSRYDLRLRRGGGGDEGQM